MSIELAERLKREWTDCYVVVKKRIPELRRFDGLVGQVKTVNMNCRLLVEFASPADISWYDIDPAFVKIVPAPEATLSDSQPTASQPATTTSSANAPEINASATAPVASTSPVGSPLDRIRQQAARGREAPSASGVSESAVTASTASGPAVVTGSSPLDRIRAQSAAAAARSQSKPEVLSSRADSAPAAAKPSKSGEPQAAQPPSAETKPVASSVAEPPPRESGSVSDQGSSVSAASDFTQDDASVTPSFATDDAVPSLFAQVQNQASDGQTSLPDGAMFASFQQVQQQARAADADVHPAPHTSGDAHTAASGEVRMVSGKCEVAGTENPVATSFKGKALPKRNDLTVVEGIGRKIEEQLHQAGIDSWAALSQADPADLKQILENAGPQFRMHCPDTWPSQAQLAEEGRWQELEDFQALLHSGRLETK